MDSKASVIVVSPTKLMSIHHTEQAMAMTIDWSRTSWPAGGSPPDSRGHSYNGVGDAAFN
jgi:hypothetical protein